MGYKKRQRQAAARQRTLSDGSQASQTSAEGNSSSRQSTWREKKDVLRFLRDYRDGCERMYHDGIAETTPRRKIGGIWFPALTEDVFREPYLVLPSSLTKQHRRIIHEGCTELGLYHVSMGSRDKARTVAISAYSDGLHADMDTEQSTVGVSPLPIYQYRPWFCRKKEFWLFAKMQTTSKNGSFGSVIL